MLLGQRPNWTDPQRRHSINIQRGFARMEARLGKLEFLPKKCWSSLPPAQSCLQDTWTKIEGFFQLDTVQTRLTRGETTNPGYCFDRFMYGRSEDNAQPTIIFDSKSKVYRNNARIFLADEAIEVDARGIGLEFYESGPVLSAGDPPAPISGFAESSSLEDTLRRPLGVSITIESTTCVIGGVISIKGRLFGLTVGHAFNDIDFGKVSIKKSNKIIGSLAFRSRTYNKMSLDWAVCTIDRLETPLVNQIALQNNTAPVRITTANKNPDNAAVLVHYGAGTISGFILPDYSLVALPGQRFPQRMWVVISDKEIPTGICGAWVIDSKNNEVYGYVVARKPQTTIVYIVLMHDVLQDIANQYQQPTVKLPTEEELSQNRVGTLQTALQLAVECRHLDMIQSLLSEGADAGKQDSGEDEETPFSWAAQNGREAIVKLLLETGKVDVDSKDSSSRTPLSWAAQNGHEAIVKLLLETGKADVDSKDSSSRTPLSWAAQNGHEAIVRLLLETGKVDVDSKDWSDQTPLSWAAQNGHEAIVKLLLETGKVEVNSKDLWDQTPLLWATRNKNGDIVKLLLDHGANIVT